MIWGLFKPRSSNYETKAQGLQVLAEGTNPVIDIVAVHGLNGHRETTWTAGNGDNGINWLRGLLPEDLPNARIFSWGYDANTSDSKVSCQYIHNHAANLVSDLCRANERPIIFIAHSLGGIVVKSALLHSDSARQLTLEHRRSIRISIYGIIFMGTPHQGSPGASFAKILARIASLFVSTSDRLLQDLRQGSSWLQLQLMQYGQISNDFETIYAYEQFTTWIIGREIMIVPRESAVGPEAENALPVVIHRDHISMVKFSSRLNKDYQAVLYYIRRMTEAAPERIRVNWMREKRIIEALRTPPLAAQLSPPNTPLESGRIYRFSITDEDVLTVLNPNGDVKLRPRNNDDSQKWRVETTDSDSLGFRNVYTGGLLGVNAAGWVGAGTYRLGERERFFLYRVQDGYRFVVDKWWWRRRAPLLQFLDFLEVQRVPVISGSPVTINITQLSN
ncbi:uncharacterized protein N7459_010112 [Penicillium hispanicum]|uniref:uncharacterized protein n=1 Tax=Penicillium hispanicum TaxID=1080232 RepID=UPI00253FC5A6|nr:uncharacterized protein N7459_010112 [Penicillium hispanicum]KAJ5566730.1 hypothetical protein N7459_010112 [Penicillium hispanicum]